MDKKPQAPLSSGDFNDPDLENSEQNEAGTQAQDVAEEIMQGEIEADESEPGSPSNPADVVPRDVPDLVDTMEGMVHSGRVDLDAFEGEEPMDDEDEDRDED